MRKSLLFLTRHTKLGKEFLAQCKSIIFFKYKYLKMYTTVQKFGVSKILILLFSKDALNWSKVTVKTIMLQTISVFK